MKTLNEVLEIMEARVDKPTLEDYITRRWLRPAYSGSGWHFDDMDIARLRLVCHLMQDIEVNEQGMDVILSLLDQLYQMRAHARSLNQAITRQPQEVQIEIMAIIKDLTKKEDLS